MLHLNIRKTLAEKGVELTPDEAKDIVKQAKHLYETITLEQYLKIKNLTEEQIIARGKKFDCNPHKSQQVTKLILVIGEVKFENK